MKINLPEKSSKSRDQIMAPASFRLTTYSHLILIDLGSSKPTHWSSLKAYGIFCSSFHSLVQPSLLVNLQISKYERKPAACVYGPDLPASEAGALMPFTFFVFKVNVRPYMANPNTSFSDGAPNSIHASIVASFFFH